VAMWALGPVYAAHGGLAYLAMAAFGAIAAAGCLVLSRLRLPAPGG